MSCGGLPMAAKPPYVAPGTTSDGCTTMLYVPAAGLLITTSSTPLDVVELAIVLLFGSRTNKSMSSPLREAVTRTVSTKLCFGGTTVSAK